MSDKRAWLASIALIALLVATSAIWQPAWTRALVGFHSLATRALTPLCGCHVTDLRAEYSENGTRLRLTAVLVGSGGTAPSAVVRSRLPVAASQHALVALLALLLAWPAGSAAELGRRAAAALGAVVTLELATTTAQLLAPLDALAAQIELLPAASGLAYWSQFLETGGRTALAMLLALAAIGVARFSASARAGASP